LGLRERGLLCHRGLVLRRGVLWRWWMWLHSWRRRRDELLLYWGGRRRVRGVIRGRCGVHFLVVVDAHVD
jgi:hypothetical protein